MTNSAGRSTATPIPRNAFTAQASTDELVMASTSKQHSERAGGKFSSDYADVVAFDPQVPLGARRASGADVQGELHPTSLAGGVYRLVP
jgi:hypothetical protein